MGKSGEMFEGRLEIHIELFSAGEHPRSSFDLERIIASFHDHRAQTCDLLVKQLVSTFDGNSDNFESGVVAFDKIQDVIDDLSLRSPACGELDEIRVTIDVV